MRNWFEGKVLRMNSVFRYQQQTREEVRLWLGRLSWPLAIYGLLAYCAGSLIGGLLAWWAVTEFAGMRVLIAFQDLTVPEFPLVYAVIIGAAAGGITSAILAEEVLRTLVRWCARLLRPDLYPHV